MSVTLLSECNYRVTFLSWSSHRYILDYLIREDYKAGDICEGAGPAENGGFRRIPGGGAGSAAQASRRPCLI